MTNDKRKIDDYRFTVNSAFSHWYIGGFYAWCAIATHRFFVATKRETSTFTQPVSILVPVCCIEAGAWENWSSFCLQDYENYEVLFGVMNPHDPNLFKWLWILPIRDLMSFVIWVAGAFGKSVYWRGRWLQVEAGGTLKEIGESSFS